MVRPLLFVTTASLFLWLAAGCASEREQTMKGYEQMHRKVRSEEGKPGKWERIPGGGN